MAWALETIPDRYGRAISGNDYECRRHFGDRCSDATALKSARGMFPGKVVSRDKIHALRGERPIARAKKAE